MINRIVVAGTKCAHLGRLKALIKRRITDRKRVIKIKDSIDLIEIPLIDIILTPL